MATTLQRKGKSMRVCELNPDGTVKYCGKWVTIPGSSQHGGSFKGHRRGRVSRVSRKLVRVASFDSYGPTWNYLKATETNPETGRPYLMDAEDFDTAAGSINQGLSSGTYNFNGDIDPSLYNGVDPNEEEEPGFIEMVEELLAGDRAIETNVNVSLETTLIFLFLIVMTAMLIMGIKRVIDRT